MKPSVWKNWLEDLPISKAVIMVGVSFEGGKDFIHFIPFEKYKHAQSITCGCSPDIEDVGEIVLVTRHHRMDKEDKDENNSSE